MDSSAQQHRQLRRLGGSELALSSLGFGSAPIGNLYRPLPEAEALAAIRRARSEGVGYFDTAPHYGFGLSESRLGLGLANADAQAAVVSTKVGRLLQSIDPTTAGGTRQGFVDAPPMEPVFDYSYDGVMRSLESSLARLGRDSVDVLWAHDLGQVTHGASHPYHWREFMTGGYRAMEELRSNGLVKAIGLGANEWEVCAQALAEGDFDGFLLAGRYTLLEQGALEEFLPLCARRGASVVLGGPFNSGILARGVTGPGPHYYNYKTAPTEVVERVGQLERICAEFRVPLAAAALQFPLAHPQICSVLAGLASEKEVERAVAWMNLELPGSLWEELRGQGLIHPQAPVPGDEKKPADSNEDQRSSEP